MKCPFCNEEMQSSCIKGDGRSSVLWIKKDSKKTFGIN